MAARCRRFGGRVEPPMGGAWPCCDWCGTCLQRLRALDKSVRAPYIGNSVLQGPRREGGAGESPAGESSVLIKTLTVPKIRTNNQSPSAPPQGGAATLGAQ